MGREWKEELDRMDSPKSASYAALRRGLIYERGYAEWCRWVIDQLEERIGREDKRVNSERPVSRK